MEDDMADPLANQPLNPVPAGAQPTTPETPDYLIPKINQYGQGSPAYYQQLFALPPAPSDSLSEFSGAIDPFADTSKLPPPLPTLGVLLTFEQNWVQRGTALGRLARSVCLAPGEVTRIAMIDWQRKSKAESSGSTSQTDTVDSGTDQDSAQRSVQNAVSSDLAMGSSFGFNAGAQAQAGGSVGFLGSGASASASASVGLGLTVSTSGDTKSLAANAVKSVNQRTLEKSSAIRSRRSDEVQEVSQSEAQTATTRVVANYNHMHALSMMYYEVLQIFQLQTRVARSERCVFLPMKLLTFDAATLQQHREAILAILNEIGQRVLAEALAAKDLGGLAALDARIADAEAKKAEWAKSRKELLDGAARSGRDEKRLKEMLAEHGGMIAQLDQTISESRAAKDLQSRDLLAVLAKEQLVLNQHLWMRMEPSRLQQLLANKTLGGEALGMTIDPRPIGVLGSLVCFRWPFADPKKEAAFREPYEATDPQKPHLAPGVDEPTVAVPSGGLFGEAVLGQAVSAEKIDLTRFWNWQESPIPILPPEMDKLSLASRGRDVTLPTLDFGAALTQLKDIPVPQGSDLEAAINGLKGMTFTNMSNTEVLAKMIGVAQEAAKTGAGAAAANALEAQKSVQDLYAKLASTAVDSQKSVQDTFVKLANSEAGKAVTNAAIAALAPEAAPATMLGGLANLKTEGKAAAETAKKVVEKTTGKAAGE
jgi:hypothetical protein